MNLPHGGTFRRYRLVLAVLCLIQTSCALLEDDPCATGGCGNPDDMDFRTAPDAPELRWQLTGNTLTIRSHNAASYYWSKDDVPVDVPPVTNSIQDPDVMKARWTVVAWTAANEYGWRTSATTTLDLAGAYNPATADTGQTFCFDNATTVDCAATSFAGQDAHHVKKPRDRFQLGDGGVVDAATQLTWQDPVSEEATCEKPWRMPNSAELQSLLNFDDDPEDLPPPFQARPSSLYFVKDGDHTSLLSLNGSQWCGKEADKPAALRCVKGGRPWVAGVLALRSEEIVVDHATGLWWMDHPDFMTISWKEALAYCQRATTGGHSDWRLPDRSELLSVGGGRSDILGGLYGSWSSTTVPCDPTQAFAGYGSPVTKTREARAALCVRR